MSDCHTLFDSLPKDYGTAGFGQAVVKILDDCGIIGDDTTQVSEEVWGCSSVGRALNWLATDTGLIPRCGKGFFFQSRLSVQTLLQCPYTPMCNYMHLHLCAR